MKYIKKAAIIALVVVVIKLLFKLIPPANSFSRLFEMGIGYGLLIIIISYIVIFIIILILLIVAKKR